MQSKGLSRVFSNTTVQKHQFFGAQLGLQHMNVAGWGGGGAVDTTQSVTVDIGREKYRTIKEKGKKQPQKSRG